MLKNKQNMIQKIQIKLTEKEKEIIIQLVNKRKIEKQLEIRLNIILKSHNNCTYKSICSDLKCSEPIVSYWKQRWSNNYEKLQVFTKGVDNKGVSDNELIKEILTILNDAPRSGAPLTFLEETQKKIQALACEKPSKYDLPFTHWTHKELARMVVLQKIVPTISSSQIGRILKKTV